VPSVGRTFQVVRDDGTNNSLDVEAESAVLAGSFAVGTDGAARNGHFISVPSGADVTTGPTSPSRATLTFDVATAGQYRIDASVLGAYRCAELLLRARRRAPANAYLWDTPISASWQTDSLSDRNGADPVLVTLAAGTHTVEVIHRETGTQLDWMRLVFVGAPRRPTATATGYPDDVDAFPNDPTEWADSDGDGHGDNSDAFPNDPTKWLPEQGVTPVPHRTTRPR
jgi:hypothetical protein